MNRLDAIKSRAAVVRAKKDNCEATYSEFAAIIRLANFDAPALVSAVEAVLALHYLDMDEEHCADCSYNWPCPTVEAIRRALGEDG